MERMTSVRVFAVRVILLMGFLALAVFVRLLSLWLAVLFWIGSVYLLSKLVLRVQCPSCKVLLPRPKFKKDRAGLLVLQNEENCPHCGKDFLEHPLYKREDGVLLKNPLFHHSLEELLVSLKSREWGTRQHAAEALRKHGADAVAPLSAALLDEKWGVRETAAESLGYLGAIAEPALKKLEIGLDDHNPVVANCCRRAIEKIGSEKAFEILRIYETRRTT